MPLFGGKQMSTVKIQKYIWLPGNSHDDHAIANQANNRSHQVHEGKEEG